MRADLHQQNDEDLTLTISVENRKDGTIDVMLFGVGKLPWSEDTEYVLTIPAERSSDLAVVLIEEIFKGDRNVLAKMGRICSDRGIATSFASF